MFLFSTTINYNVKAMFGFSIFGKKNKSNYFDISFNSRDVDYGTHGYIIAVNKKVGINKPCPVRFVFKGMTTPPPLTEDIIQALFQAARNEGYDVKSLKTYGLKVVTKQPSNLSASISHARKAAENGRLPLNNKGVKDATIA